jgi:transcriptional regulator of acetoin/glycerol metabolism
MEYSWPGNVRELEHVLEHAFVLCRGGIITLEHLPTEIREPEKTKVAAEPNNLRNKMIGVQEILEALKQAHWNKTKAARLLGISRRTLHRKIQDQSLLMN